VKIDWPIADAAEDLAKYLRYIQNNLYEKGALKGRSTEEAFRIKCDAETNPSQLRELGKVVTEIYLAVWVMLALLFYWDALLRGRGFWWTSLFAALAIMTKGIMGFMPYGIIFIHLVVTRSWSELRSRRLWLALVGTLVLVLPWHIIMVMRFGDAFLTQYFWNTQLSFITGTSHVDPWHWSTITRKMLETYWPWLLVLIPSLLASGRVLWCTRPGTSEEDPVSSSLVSGRFGGEAERRWLVFLWVWLAVIFLFFHLTYVKRHQYVLPAYPAMACMSAWGIWRLREVWRDRVLAAIIVFAAAAVAVATFTPIWPQSLDKNYYGARLEIVRYLHARPDLEGTLLILDKESKYCFTCDTVAFYTDLNCYPLDSVSLARESATTKALYIMVHNQHLRLLESELPAGWHQLNVYTDDQVTLLRIVEG